MGCFLMNHNRKYIESIPSTLRCTGENIMSYHENFVRILRDSTRRRGSVNSHWCIISLRLHILVKSGLEALKFRTAPFELFWQEYLRVLRKQVVTSYGIINRPQAQGWDSLMQTELFCGGASWFRARSVL